MKLDKLSDVSENTYVARIRGVPWSATKDEIADFFGTCQLADDKEKSVIVNKTREGRPSGEAYVLFASQDDLDEAMKKDREHMGKRYIEVFPAKYEEVEWAMNRDVPVDMNNENLLRLRGLPWDTKPAEVKKFFDGIKINPNCIMLTTDDMGRSSGEAFVQFNSKEDAKAALKKNRETLGSRYIEIFPSSMREAYNEKMKSNVTRGRPGPYDRMPSYGRGFGRNMKGSLPRQPLDLDGMGAIEGMGGISGHAIRMRGLPFSATEMEVAEWFSSVADPIQVSIDYNREGKPSGDATVYFKTAQDVKSAMARNKQNMQHRYIELFDVSSGGLDLQQPMGLGMATQMLGGGLQSMGMGGNTSMAGMGMSGMGLSNLGSGAGLDPKYKMLMAKLAQQSANPLGLAQSFGL